MKKMVCEICGSNEIEKKDGVYVCKSCGTQYSTEEAKKLLVEVSGTVEVSGSVKIDNSDKLANLYSNARRNRDAGNYEEAAKYYDYILMDDPDSWEANFYSVLSKALSCKIAEIKTYAVLVANSLPGVLKLIKNNVVKKEQNATVKEVANQIASLYQTMAQGTYDFHKPYHDFVSIASDVGQCAINAGASGDAIEAQFGENKQIVKNALIPWEVCVNLSKELLELRPSKVDPLTLTKDGVRFYTNLNLTYYDKYDCIKNPAEYRRRQEEAEEKKREEEEAKHPKTEEGILKKEMEENSNYGMWLTGAIISIAIGLVTYLPFIVVYHEFPGIALTITTAVLFICSWKMIVTSKDKKKKYEEASNKLAECLEKEEKTK